MNESQLVQAIKVHIAKGDKAADKADQHYRSAGQHLKTLKATHGGSWAEWEELLKTKVGIGKSRASELMRIADGTKTVEQVRAESAERKAKERAKSLRDVTEKSVPLPSLRSEDNAGDPELSAEAMKAQFASDEEEAVNCQEISMTPLEGTTSWQVQVTDESGKVWSNGVRLAGRDEAMCYMGHALHDFRDNEAAVVEIRAVRSSDAPNIGVERCQRGPRKGRARLGNAIIFPDGGCHNFEWHESGAESVAVKPLDAPPLNDDGLDIPDWLRRAPKAAAS